MNNFPTQEEILALRKQYPKGTNVKLVKMNDRYREMPTGLKGVVESVDDAGTIHVSWENGSNLGIAYGEDECEKIEKVYAITEDYDVEEKMICESEKEGLLYFNTEIEALKYTKILIEGKLETRRKYLQKLNQSIENEKCEIFVLSERLSEISTELNLHKLENEVVPNKIEPIEYIKLYTKPENKTSVQYAAQLSKNLYDFKFKHNRMAVYLLSEDENSYVKKGTVSIIGDDYLMNHNWENICDTKEIEKCEKMYHELLKQYPIGEKERDMILHLHD